MKANVKPYRRHLTSSNDLITSHLALRGRSAALALERKKCADSFISQVPAIKVAASSAATARGLARIEGIQAAVLTASGVSQEERLRLRPKEKAAAIQRFVNKVLVPAGPNFVDELVHRFLSANEDALSVTMRDVGNVLARRKLSSYIIATLALSGTPYRRLHSDKSWAGMSGSDSGIELYLRGLSWSKGKRRRTVIFNLTVPFLKNNVDVCLFDSGPEDVSSVYTSPAAYVALGELKGGIDPASADEHWKTARAALDRIRKGFGRYGKKPHTFLIAAAIAKKMAGEIWDELEDGMLENAANLTNDDQVASLSRWLCGL